MMQEDATVSRNGDWIVATANDETVMMSVSSGHILGLNDMATHIWRMLDHPRDVSDLRNSLQVEFDVSPARCATELDTFLTDMAKRGAVLVN